MEKTLEQHEKTSHTGHEHGAHGHADHPHATHATVGEAPCCSTNAAAALAVDASVELKDPVCGMRVPAKSPHVLEHEGQPVYFCSAGCKAKFAADPAKYAKPAGGAAATAIVDEPVRLGTIYTCPMHPEVRQDHPGACPKCGMALEPEMPSLDEGESPEMVDFRRRFR